MKKILVSLLLLSNICFAQNGKSIDSIITLAKNSFYIDYKKTIALGYKAAILSHAIQDYSREATAYNIKAVGHQFKGEIDSALASLQKAHGLALKVNDPQLSGKINANFGSNYLRLGKYDKALSYGFEGLRCMELAKDTIGISRAMADVANVFLMLNNNEKGVEYLQQAITLATKVGDVSATGNFYNSLAVGYRHQKKFNEAGTALQKALRIFKQYNNVKGQLTVTVNLSQVKRELKQPLDLDDVLAAVQIGERLGDRQRLGELYNILSNEYNRLGNQQEAIKYILLSVKYEEEAKDLDNLITTLKDLSYLYTDQNDFKKAYMVRMRIGMLQDTLYDLRSTKQLHDAEVRFETDKKQQQIQLLSKQSTIDKLEINNQELLLNNQELMLNNQGLTIRQTRQTLNAKDLEAKAKGQQVVLLNKQNTIQQLSIASRNKTIGIIAGMFLLAIIFTGLFYSRAKLKQKATMQAQMLAQQETLTRAVIEAEEKERQRIASDLHDGVGQLFSAVKMNMNGLFDRIEIKRDEDKFLVEKTMALVDESCKEVRSISHQMMPNNMLLRSGIASDVKSFIEKIDSESLKVNLEANGFKNRIESNVEVVLYRVIQESVNNVIKHAKATRLDILLNRTPSGISVLIEDNGVGFNTADRVNFDGIGLSNIETRIEYLKGTVVYDSAPGKGTRVKIAVPV